MTTEEVLALLRKRCATAGSQSEWARAHKLSVAYVSDVLKGNRLPGHGIVDALGLEREPPRFRRRRGKANGET